MEGRVERWRARCMYDILCVVEKGSEGIDLQAVNGNEIHIHITMSKKTNMQYA
jgi:hypothetical protein